MAISPQRLTIYLYCAHRAVIFAIAQLSCFTKFLQIQTQDSACHLLFGICAYVQNAAVSGDESPLNLSLTGSVSRPTADNQCDVIDDQPEVTRHHKAELMTSLRLTDTSESPTPPEVEMSLTDWNGNHLLYEPPPPCKRRRQADTDEDGGPEAEVEEEEAGSKGRASLFMVLAACSFTDIYNSYQRRQTRLQTPEVHSNKVDSEAGSGLTAEVDEEMVDTDRKSPPVIWNTAVVHTEGQLAPPIDNDVYPLAARYAFHYTLLSVAALKF